MTSPSPQSLSRAPTEA
uniref:Uncharacterized protein n=1 Tax=Anguilla anguilla TaxID=7936 RepID=A0A0E9PF17_ANGAN